MNCLFAELFHGLVKYLEDCYILWINATLEPSSWVCFTLIKKTKDLGFFKCLFFIIIIKVAQCTPSVSLLLPSSVNLLVGQCNLC